MKMKTALTLLASAALATSALASAGPGPWANSTWYPGSLDGKYQAAVYGKNISGVVGFALSSGAPTTATTSTLNMTNGSSQSTLTVNPFQNYYAIFVEGRTYTGIALANINTDNSSITGALIGAQPDFKFNDKILLTAVTTKVTNKEVSVIGERFEIIGTYITNGTNVIGPLLATNRFDVLETNFIVTLSNAVTETPYQMYDPTPLLNRGLNGGFQAKITGNEGTFTFVGDGQLTTPSQNQTINLERNALLEVVGSEIVTDTIPFKINGIRVSFSTTQ